MSSQTKFLCIFFIPIIPPTLRSVNSFFVSIFNSLNDFFIRQLSNFINKKSILHFSNRMILSCKQCIKIPKTCLNKISRHFLKTHLSPNFSSIINCRINKMSFTSINMRNRQIQIISSKLFTLPILFTFQDFRIYLFD